MYAIRSYYDSGRRVSAYLLPVFSGILVGTSYVPFPPWALFFCLVPLWLFWLGEVSWKRILLGGWVAQFVFTLTGFHWVAHTAREFGHLPWIAAALALLLFCCVGRITSYNVCYTKLLRPPRSGRRSG